MTCSKIKEELTYAIYEIFPDGREYDTEKSFSISKEENDNVLKKFAWDYLITDSIHDYAIILTMFHKLYNFTIGLNGFRLIWDTDKQYESGSFQSPQCNGGGIWWKIKLVK